MTIKHLSREADAKNTDAKQKYIALLYNMDDAEIINQYGGGFWDDFQTNPISGATWHKYEYDTFIQNPSRFSFTPQSIVRKLDLAETKITTLSRHIDKLPWLLILILYDNRLLELPREISNLSYLTTLIIAKNKIRHLPNNIGKLSSLVFLYAQDNDLLDLPSSIGDLQNLQKLNVSGNKLKKLPATIGKITNLENLDASNNHISEIPTELWELQKLKYLNVSINRINNLNIPEGRKFDLEYILASYNFLQVFPFESFPKLTKIYLNFNQLKTIRNLYIRKEAMCPNLKWLIVSNNLLNNTDDKPGYDTIKQKSESIVIPATPNNTLEFIDTPINETAIVVSTNNNIRGAESLTEDDIANASFFVQKELDVFKHIIKSYTNDKNVTAYAQLLKELTAYVKNLPDDLTPTQKGKIYNFLVDLHGCNYFQMPLKKFISCVEKQHDIYKNLKYVCIMKRYFDYEKDCKNKQDNKQCLSNLLDKLKDAKNTMDDCDTNECLTYRCQQLLPKSENKKRKSDSNHHSPTTPQQKKVAQPQPQPEAQPGAQPHPQTRKRRTRNRQSGGMQTKSPFPDTMKGYQALEKVDVQYNFIENITDTQFYKDVKDIIKDNQKAQNNVNKSHYYFNYINQFPSSTPATEREISYDSLMRNVSENSQENKPYGIIELEGWNKYLFGKKNKVQSKKSINHIYNYIKNKPRRTLKKSLSKPKKQYDLYDGEPLNDHDLKVYEELKKKKDQDGKLSRSDEFMLYHLANRYKIANAKKTKEENQRRKGSRRRSLSKISP